jgi:heme oxygenase
LRLDVREDYARFLRIHARVVPSLEQAVEAGRPWSDWSARAPLLLEDLLSLQIEAPAPGTAPESVTEAERWGIQYVLEGSKLGGEVLSARVAEGLPRRYLGAGHKKGDWARFQAELQSAAEEGGEDWAAMASQAARSAFAKFETALKIELGQARER